jgi:GAF domain-containing protein
MPASRPALDELRHLGLALADGRLKRQAYRLAVVDLLRRRFACSRASLWRLSARGGALRLVCRASAGDGGALQGSELAQAQCAPYFARITSQGVFACEDTWSEPALAPLRASYLDFQGVRALMDAGFDVNGRLYGVLCCEQLGAPRLWEQADRLELLRMARLISLQVARALPQELRETALGGLDLLP